MIHLAAAADDLEFETHAAHLPQPLNENTGGGRAKISKQVVQFAPLVDNPSAPPVDRTLARSLGFNSMIIAPMIRGDTVIVRSAPPAGSRRLSTTGRLPSLRPSPTKR